MTVQDQYTSNVRQGQEAWASAVQSLTDNVQQVFDTSATSFGSPSPVAAIDQVFDFWKQTLDVQREVTKQLVGAFVATGELVRFQAESGSAALREQAQSVAQAVREQAHAAEQAAHVEAATKYEALSKDELQSELGRRNLVKSGNVEELRERLIGDDQK